MLPEPRKKASLRRAYGLLVEVGLVATLLLLILAFRVNLQADAPITFTPPPQALIEVTEIPQTLQRREPPPPPRPPVPVEVPNDEIIEDDVPIIDASLEIDIPLPLDGPPPPILNGSDDTDVEPDTFVVVEQMPEPVGGLAEIQKKIKYPEIARKAGVEGRVIIQFIVNENGTVSEPAVVRGIGAGCDQEALRVVREAKFKPGKQRGKSVKVKMSLPITFKLK